jgi:hypothetical protein
MRETERRRDGETEGQRDRGTESQGDRRQGKQAQATKCVKRRQICHPDIPRTRQRSDRKISDRKMADSGVRCWPQLPSFFCLVIFLSTRRCLHFSRIRAHPGNPWHTLRRLAYVGAQRLHSPARYGFPCPPRTCFRTFRNSPPAY